MIEIVSTPELTRRIGFNNISSLECEGIIHGYRIEYRDERFVGVFTFSSAEQMTAFLLRYR